MQKFYVLFTQKIRQIYICNFNDLRATDELGNRCSIRLSYGTGSLIFNAFCNFP